MSRLADPRVCPDCRALLDQEGRCQGCGLHLRGPLAVELWGVMQSADTLVERLRAAVPAPAGPAAAAPAAPVTAPAAGPAPVPPRPVGVSASSVPVVLLTLGGLCLVVFALVFVGVAWSLLGLLGRTVVLLAVTASLGGVARLLTRRGLRASAEAMWLTTAGMLAVDLYAAEASGLFGLDALPDREGHALVGVALVGLGLVVALLARRTPLGTVFSMQAVAVVGAVVVAAAEAWTRTDPAFASTLAVVVAAGLGLAVRPRLRWARLGLLALAPVSWLVLLAAGAVRSVESVDAGAWWGQARWWPLLAAALLAAVVVHAPRVPALARPVAAGLALVPVVVAVNAPATLGSASADVVAMVVSVLLVAAVAAYAPTTWARAGAVLAALGGLVLGLVLVGRSLLEVGQLFSGPTGAATGLLPPAGSDAASWTAVVVALGVVLAAASLLRHAAEPVVPTTPTVVRGIVLAAAPGVLALGLLVLLLGLEPVRWTAALGGLVATGVGAGAAWWWRRETGAAVAASAVAAYVGMLTLGVAANADEAWLPAAAATALALPLVAAMLVRDRERGDSSAVALAVAGVLLAGFALVTWAAWLDLGETVQAITLASYAGIVGLLAAPVTRLGSTRVALEASALTAAAVGLALAPDEAVAAVVLTVAGSAVALLAVLHRDRELASWFATALLATATLLRFVAEVTAPELVTLPAAALLLAVGTHRLHRDPAVGSTRVLGSGLVLALVPSLLLALGDPVSLRGALVGAAAVLTLAWGVTQRLAAPFSVGAAVTAVLVLRHLGPVADAVPSWVVIGTVGVALLVVGVSWESSLRGIGRARRYVTSLR